jgi:hypothetical protein
MFRKFSDKLQAASSWMTNGGDAAKIRQLTAMGFSDEAASRALQAADGNVDQAANFLLQHQTPASPVNREEADLQRAMQASLEASTPPTTARTKPQRAAAVSKAAQAAQRRANGGVVLSSAPSSGNSSLSRDHPAVKIIPKLSDKSAEEQILRCADRLKSSHQAVDTLIKALTAVQRDPDAQKFRTVDKTTTGYQRSIAPAVGADDFLRAMKYRAAGPNRIVLDRHNVDPALLYLGISALEQTKLTAEYQAGKARQMFEKEIATMRSTADSSETEAVQRANYLSRVPTEPTNGRSAFLQVALGAETVRRRFEGDDTLQDVLYWLGAHGSEILQRLEQGEWLVRDINRNPAVSLDPTKHARDTLQYLGCWPSGRLDVVPRAIVEATAASSDSKPGSSRGLGAAPTDALL